MSLEATVTRLSHRCSYVLLNNVWLFHSSGYKVKQVFHLSPQSGFLSAPLHFLGNSLVKFLISDAQWLEHCQKGWASLGTEAWPHALEESQFLTRPGEWTAPGDQLGSYVKSRSPFGSKRPFHCGVDIRLFTDPWNKDNWYLICYRPSDPKAHKESQKNGPGWLQSQQSQKWWCFGKESCSDYTRSDS